MEIEKERDVPRLWRRWEKGKWYGCVRLCWNVYGRDVREMGMKEMVKLMGKEEMRVVRDED